MTAATDNPWRAIALIAALLAVVTVATLAVGALPSRAQGTAPGPITAEPLTGRHVFSDDVAMQVRLKPRGRAREVVNLQDASRLAVLRITVPPGARFPWHTHPGPVLVAVQSGSLTYVYADDCAQRRYPSGKAFVDPGGANVHTAFNPTAEPTVLIATFLNAPSSGPLTLPVPASRSAALDARCGMPAATAHAH